MRVSELYDDHPISAAAVLAAARARGRGLVAPLTPDDLFDFDQDHYGGLAAVDVLATRAAIRRTSRVLDVCAGLAGPARFLASRRGCRVVAVEVHPGRAREAGELTARVGLTDRVRVVRGDAARLPVRARSFDACLSQEGLLHIADKQAVLAECRRALVAGGRLAFTDWIARPRLADGERARLERWMAATTLQSIEGYRTLLGRVGFQAIEADDLSREWRSIIRERLATYRGQQPDRRQRVGPERWDRFLELYTFFARLVEDGKLGGARFTATA